MPLERIAPTRVYQWATGQDPTKPSFWEDIMDISYQDFLDKLRQYWPQAADVVPCLIEQSETRQGSNDEYRLLRAYRHIAVVVSKDFAKKERYLKEYENDALEDLIDDIDAIRPLWSKYQCKKGKPNAED